MNKISYDVINGGTLEIIQDNHDGVVTVARRDTDREYYNEILSIRPGHMVMLINLYRHVINNDIQNDFINPNGKNKESGISSIECGLDRSDLYMLAKSIISSIDNAYNASNMVSDDNDSVDTIYKYIRKLKKLNDKLEIMIEKMESDRVDS